MASKLQGVNPGCGIIVKTFLSGIILEEKTSNQKPAGQPFGSLKNVRSVKDSEELNQTAG